MTPLVDLWPVAIAYLLTLGASGALAGDITLKGATTIDKTTTVAPGTYSIVDASGEGVIRIQGDNLVIDFQNAQLNGSRPDQSSDEYSGVGIAIEGRNITLKNARIHGYKVGIHAVQCPNINSG
jgi:hypothetical protein